MSSLSMVEARLPPGFRFHPRDDELVVDYLYNKLANAAAAGANCGVYGFPTLVDVDLNKCEPWDLPEVACVGGKEWYFFSMRDRKYATGQRTNRATGSGYWKATGKDRLVSRKGLLVGMRKTLVFYRGRAPKGKKTEWVMHEFRTADAMNDAAAAAAAAKASPEDWVLCRVSYKSRSCSTKTSADGGDGAPASTLPPLVDSYIAFDHAVRALEGYEQVPCLSSRPQTATPGWTFKEMLSQFTGVDGAVGGVVKMEVPGVFSQDAIQGFLADNAGLPLVWNS